jgi:hypothetical protein
MIFGFDVHPDACFAPDYVAARERFLAAARAAGGLLSAYDNPTPGPNGEELSTDVAWFGPPDAGRVLVLVSATHGVEGFCGSGAQIDWIMVDGPGLLPPDTAVLIIHALNPYGFAWLRRTTEEGVDLNRNGIAFDQKLPDNAAYDELADAFVPHNLETATLAAADEVLARWREKHGARAFEQARSSGQYTRPEGIFYGGTGPTWSMRTLQRMCADFGLAGRRAVAVIDYHTGLGPHGHGEPICGHRPGESGQARCRAWYGDSLGEPLLGTSFSLPIVGLTQYAWARAVGAEKLTFVALEFGTYDAEVGARALRDDHVLHRASHVEWHDDTCRRVKSALRKFYHPDTRAWKEMVLFRSRQVIGQGLGGLVDTL